MTISIWILRLSGTIGLTIAGIHTLRGEYSDGFHAVNAGLLSVFIGAYLHLRRQLRHLGPPQSTQRIRRRPGVWFRVRRWYHWLFRGTLLIHVPPMTEEEELRLREYLRSLQDRGVGEIIRRR